MALSTELEDGSEGYLQLLEGTSCWRQWKAWYSFKGNLHVHRTEELVPTL